MADLISVPKAGAVEAQVQGEINPLATASFSTRDQSLTLTPSEAQRFGHIVVTTTPQAGELRSAMQRDISDILSSQTTLVSGGIATIRSESAQGVGTSQESATGEQNSLIIHTERALIAEERRRGSELEGGVAGYENESLSLAATTRDGAGTELDLSSSGKLLDSREASVREREQAVEAREKAVEDELKKVKEEWQEVKKQREEMTEALRSIYAQLLSIRDTVLAADQTDTAATKKGKESSSAASVGGPQAANWMVSSLELLEAVLSKIGNPNWRPDEVEAKKQEQPEKAKVEEVIVRRRDAEPEQPQKQDLSSKPRGEEALVSTSLVKAA